MSKDLESKSKKELIEIISQFREKLEVMQVVEAKQEASETNLSCIGMSVIKDPTDGNYKIVHISYDYATGAAKVTNTYEPHPPSFAFTLYKAKEYLINTIMNDDHLGHLLKENKNG
jgi:hypothetical protein